MRTPRGGRTAALLVAIGALAFPTCAAAYGPSEPTYPYDPGPAVYAMSSSEADVTMSDGVRLSARVTVPTDPQSGEPAAEEFPVVMQVTPYMKDPPMWEGASGAYADDFVPRGYVHALVDVRGTGASGGSFEALGAREVRDYVELVHWAAGLPGSNGRVGMLGASYLAINQLAAAGSIGRHSPLKAIVPIVPGFDLYRDLMVPGGLFNAEFGLPYAMVFEAGLDMVGPVLSGNDPAQVVQDLIDHLEGVMEVDIKTVMDAVVGGERAYDADFWQLRRPARWIARIPHNRVPTLVLGGWFDIWQRSVGRVYSGLQNAAAGRSVYAPMRPGQKPDRRYQAIYGPYVHQVDPGWWTPLAFAWFDRYLKGKDTGIERTRRPLRAYEVEGGRWVETTTWPPPGIDARRWYFGPGRTGTTPQSINDGTLTAEPPQEPGAESIPWWGILNSPCSRSTDQEFVNGPLKGYGDALGFPYENFCTFDDRGLQFGALVYSTDPLARDLTIAGPGSVTLFATANTTQTEWVVELADVAPDGSSRPLGTYALLGSLRALDEQHAWRIDGRRLVPYHPYTPESEQPVQPGELTRYDIELPGILARIRAGHRIRVVVQTANFPYLVPKGSDTYNLFGGAYDVHRSPGAASFVTLPVIRPGELRTSPIEWGPCVTDC